MVVNLVRGLLDGEEEGKNISPWSKLRGRKIKTILHTPNAIGGEGMIEKSAKMKEKSIAEMCSNACTMGNIERIK